MKFLYKYFAKIKEIVSNLGSLNLKKKLIILSVSIGVIIVAIVLIVFRDQIFLANITKNRVINSDVPTESVCSLPKVEVKEHAFTIGVPQGWLYEFNNGTVSIMKDENNLEGAFLYTAKLIKKDFTAKEFLTASSGFFTKAVAEEGGTFGVVDVIVSGDNAQGTIEASLDGTPITGLYRVEKDGDFITMRAYYAPKVDIINSQDNLKEVIGCFSRTATISTEMLEAVTKVRVAESVELDVTSGFTKYVGKYFSLSLPTGYNVTGESDSGIDISRNDMSAGFSYAYVTGAKGPYTPKQWAEYALPEYVKIDGLALGDAKTVSSEVPGMTVHEFSFTGVLNKSIDVEGEVTIGIINTTDYGLGSSSSAFWAIQIAKPDVWSSVSVNLKAMQDSLVITDIGDTRRNTMLPPNHPMESTSSRSIASKTQSSMSDEANGNWADTMRGYETVESPSTGERFDVPLNSWSNDGPDGPGYNRLLPNNGGTEKLIQD